MIAWKKRQELPSAGAAPSRACSALIILAVLAGCTDVQTADLRANVIENGELIPVVLDDLDPESSSVVCEGDACLAASATGEPFEGRPQ